MKYSKEVIARATDEIKNRKLAAEDTLTQHNADIAQNAPEIYAVSQKLVNTNVALALEIIRHGKNSEIVIDEIKDENQRQQNKIRSLLINFGYPENYLDANYACKICNDTGYKEGKACRCLTALLDKYASEELNCNSTIELQNFSSFRIDYYNTAEISGISPRQKMAETLEYCQNYCKQFNEHSASLFFFGNTGLGKTFLSACIAKEISSNGNSVVFGSIMNYLRMIENEYFGRAEGNTIDIIINADLVILDDLGSEFQSKFSESTLYNIINSRINLNKPTIISTNLSMSELNTRYNERIVSRLTGYYIPLKFIGSDIRHFKRRNGIF